MGLLVGRWAEGHTQRPELGWVPHEASTFIDVCTSPLGPVGFLVSLLVGEGSPAKAIQAVDSAPNTQRHGQSVQDVVDSPALQVHWEVIVLLEEFLFLSHSVLKAVLSS